MENENWEEHGEFSDSETKDDPHIINTGITAQKLRTFLDLKFWFIDVEPQTNISIKMTIERVNLNQTTTIRTIKLK